MIQALHRDRCHFYPSPASSRVICRSIQWKVKDFFSFFTCSMSDLIESTIDFLSIALYITWLVYRIVDGRTYERYYAVHETTGHPSTTRHYGTTRFYGAGRHLLAPAGLVSLAWRSGCGEGHGEAAA